MQPNPMVLRRVLVFLVLMALAILPLLAIAQVSRVSQIRQAIDETNLTVLRGNVHPLARAEFDRGPVPSNLALRRMLLVIKRSPEQETALGALLEQQQDKSSANYHHWLTPEEFGQQFGPADQDLQTIRSWLESHGLQVNRIAKGRGAIEFSGTASQLKEALHTEIHEYEVNGERHLANANDPQIPSALDPVVTGVASLHSFRKKPLYRLAGVFARSKETGKVKPRRPEFTYTCGYNPNTGQPITCYPLAPYDFATIYNVLPLWNAIPAIDGTGQSIAIVAQSNIKLQDVSDFQNLFGLPANPPQIILDGPDPGLVPGDETEADLDVEWSGAVAKGAAIKLVVSESTETSSGADLSALYIVDNNVAPVMSESFGQCDSLWGRPGTNFTTIFGSRQPHRASRFLWLLVTTGRPAAISR